MGRLGVRVRCPPSLIGRVVEANPVNATAFLGVGHHDLVGESAGPGHIKDDPLAVVRPAAVHAGRQVDELPLVRAVAVHQPDGGLGGVGPRAAVRGPVGVARASAGEIGQP